MSRPAARARTAADFLDRLAERTGEIDDPVVRARLAGLRYVGDDRPGIRRRRRGRGWSYVDPDGQPIRDRETLARIAALAIPPAWTEVWICPSPKGHLQATGRDDRGRKQYRYHELWRAVSDATKFARLVPFALALPALRRRVRRDLARPTLDRRRVLAGLVRLLESTHVRVGNEEYARDNDSYGLTTLEAEHVEVDGDDVHLEFAGKGGREHVVDLTDPKIAEMVRECQEIPGCELFAWTDAAGRHHRIDSGDVNDYLREAMGGDLTAKDFRTWAGTVAAVEALLAMDPPASAAEAKRNVVAAIKQVAEELRNTPAVTRQFYVHPAVLAAYENGTLAETCAKAAAAVPPEEQRGLRRSERMTLAVLGAG
ncbi:MAG TPA: DNA topoisomerase IB [Thermoanaerobaculia bacterium]|nr:DNA topoisomerase IB [Thermoanaerobaculia bacterium]